MTDTANTTASGDHQAEANKFPIPFRVYHLPNGRQTRETFFCDCKATHDMAKDVINAGYRFEAERLRDGTISLTCHSIEDEEDITIEFCLNELAIAETVRKLIINSHKVACP